MAAANDNRNMSSKRARAQAARSLATMTRIIHEIYGAKNTERPNAKRGRDGRLRAISNS